MNRETYTLKDTCFDYFAKSGCFVRNTIIPKARQASTLAIRFCHQTLMPITQKSLKLTKAELQKIHQKQNWFKRCGKTMFENSIGLALAILSTKIVQHFVEVRELSNLWGLFATRPVVSEATYETLSFMIELVIALLVFTISEHFFEEYRNRQNEQT